MTNGGIGMQLCYRYEISSGIVCMSSGASWSTSNSSCNYGCLPVYQMQQKAAKAVQTEEFEALKERLEDKEAVSQAGKPSLRMSVTHATRFSRNWQIYCGKRRRPMREW